METLKSKRFILGGAELTSRLLLLRHNVIEHLFFYVWSLRGSICLNAVTSPGELRTNLSVNASCVGAERGVKLLSVWSSMKLFSGATKTFVMFYYVCRLSVLL